MLPLLLFNVISSLVVDKATDLATEHVESMIDDLLPSSAKKELDKAIKEDPAHQFTTAKEAFAAAVERSGVNPNAINLNAEWDLYQSDKEGYKNPLKFEK